MKIYTRKIKGNLLWLIIFLILFGYYDILLIFSNFYSLESSRLITIPIRGLSLFCMVLLLLMGRKEYYLKNLSLFVIFSLLYIFRMCMDTISLANYYLSLSQLLVLYISYAVIPFVLFDVLVFNKEDFVKIENCIVLSAFFFSLLTSWFYYKYIGTVGRLSTNTVGEEVLSPLALSYGASLCIGIVIVMFISKSVKKGWRKVLLIITVVASVIPFLLGASRGAILSLAVSLLLYGIHVFRRETIGFKIKLLIIVSFISFALGYAAIQMGSSVFDRLLSINDAIEEGRSSAVRIDIWKQALSQFMEFPLLGDSFVIRGFNLYAHNIVVEVLLTTGILGFIPFIFLIGRGFRSAFNVFSENPAYSWVSIMFFQCFVRMLFSGSLYSGSWFWLSLGLLFALDKYNSRNLIYGER